MSGTPVWLFGWSKGLSKETDEGIKVGMERMRETKLTGISYKERESDKVIENGIEGKDYLLCNVCLGLTGKSLAYKVLVRHLKPCHDMYKEEYKEMYQDVPIICSNSSLTFSRCMNNFYTTKEGEQLKERYRKETKENNPMHNPKHRAKFEVEVRSLKRRKKITNKLKEQYRDGTRRPPEEFVYKNTKTGWFYSEKNGKEIFYRSSCELDAYRYLEQQEDVVSYECNVFLRIPLESGSTYFPDALVTYKNGDKVLVEIKPIGWLGVLGASSRNSSDMPLFIEKLDAAEKYCEEQDWKFEIWEQ